MFAAPVASLPAFLDPDRDEARRWLTDELTRADYHRPESIVRQVIGWISDRLGFVINLIPGVDGLASVVIVVVVLAAVVGIALMIRGRWRRRVLTQKSSGAVLEDPTLTPADYRSRAAAALRSGDWDAAVLDYYRAVASDVVQRTVLDERPGRTAHEIALELEAPFPEQSAAVYQVAADFDDVRYGHRHTTRARAEAARELDQAIRRARPRHREFVGGHL